VTAFAEASISCEAGIRTRHLENGMMNLRELYRSSVITGIDLGAIYKDFR